MPKLSKQKEGTAGRSVLNVSFFHARNMEPFSVLFSVSLAFNSMSFVTITAAVLNGGPDPSWRRKI